MEQPDGKIRPITFHSHILNLTELNYDTHDKELLAIFEAFKIWRHYLEGSQHIIDMVTDHKNLEYFATMKMLSRRQAHWSKYLSAFNLLVHFHSGKLRTKPDTLTHCSDMYPKKGDSDYARVNPQNFHPVFTMEQLASSL